MLVKPFLDESHELFRESCTRFAEREIKPYAYEWEEAEGFPRELYFKAAKAGILGASMPEAYGGGGGDVLHGLVMTESLLRGGSSGVVAGLGSLNIALPVLLVLADEEQKQRFIPPVLRGEQIAALGVTEPGAGSDVSGLRLRARRDGDDYVLSGSKTFITSGAVADIVVTLARTGDHPHDGLTFFVVETAAKGFSASKRLKKTGWRASDTAELSYDDVRVPVRNRLGDEGSGFRAVMQTFQGERLGLAAFGHGSAEIALDEAMRYAREREAFGRPLAGHQVTRHKLAEMATEVTVAKAFNYLVARRVADGAYLPREVSMAKNFSSSVAQRVCYEAVQIFGGMGYMRETLVERLARDVRLLPIGGGTQEIMNEVISKMLPLR
ncbi:MAG: acyl-CoA dehydrogenase family protein [Myxococcales bacterium]|nr:acyl-CoA dehydrogenase family protein [Myxococcales bacterium]